MGITLQNVSFAYPDKPVLRDFSCELPDAGVTCLTGPSGCGKTTVLRLLVGLEKPASGEIMNVPERVSVMFQEDRLLPWATAEENVRLVRDTADAAEWLDAVGLSDVRDALPDALSGGMRRRVALARALAAPSDLLLLDEPFTGLDRALVESLSALIRKIAAKKPVVMVTHNAEEIELLSAATVPLTPLAAPAT